MATIFFTTPGTLNNKLNTLFTKLKRPRIRQWYAIIDNKVYFVRRDIPSTTMKDLKNTPKGKVMPTSYNWGISNELFYNNNPQYIEKLKKGKDIFGNAVNVSF